MNSRQLQYAVLLAEMRNFSHVADRLKISQPALSKQIISLENELEVKLFDRSSIPLTLTPAGEFFIEKARELLFQEDLLLKTMSRYQTGEIGKLVIGVAPFRSLYLMPKLIRALKEHFPHLQVVLAEYTLSLLQKGLAEGAYDFAIMNLPVDETAFDVIPLEPDTLVLAVPNHMLSLIEPTPDLHAGSPVDLACCEKLPFAVVSPEQEMRKLFDKLCSLAEIHPYIYTEVVGITTAWAMAREGIAATLLPKQFVQNEASRYDVTLLELKQTTYTRQPAIVTRRGQFVSKYAEYAIEHLRGW